MTKRAKRDTRVARNAGFNRGSTATLRPYSIIDASV